MSPDLVRLSKFLSLVLRHEPERIGIVLDRSDNGVWLTAAVPVGYLEIPG